MTKESFVRLPRSDFFPGLYLTLFNFEGTFPQWNNGGIAQLGEHLLCKQGVSGSIPLISTMKLNMGP